MNRKAISIIFCLVGLAWANQTRLNTLIAGDYIDDIVNIGLYPHQIYEYKNNLFGDIMKNLDDYGIIITPKEKYGVLACWHNIEDNGFNCGYALNLFRFNVGVSVSPVEEHFRFGLGIGRTLFNRRFDLSFILNDGLDDEWYKINLRYTCRKADFNIVPRYTFNYVNEPRNYKNHSIGLMLQRLVLNDGFVYLIFEYDFSRGDIKNDFTNIYAGVELKVTRYVVLRCGMAEQFTNGFEEPVWRLEPGIGLRIREFSFDFHLNKDRLFDKDVTFINSFGLDLNFGRF